MCNTDEAKHLTDLFETWAKDHLGQGYSLEREEHTYINPVTRWAFIASKAGRKGILPDTSKHNLAINQWAFDKCICAGELHPNDCVYKRSDVVEILKMILDKTSYKD